MEKKRTGTKKKKQTGTGPRTPGVVRVQRWGGVSLACTLTREAVEALKLEPGQKLKVSVKGSQVVLTKFVEART
jgi:molybdopterin-binding protein